METPRFCGEIGVIIRGWEFYIARRSDVPDFANMISAEVVGTIPESVRQYGVLCKSGDGGLEVHHHKADTTDDVLGPFLFSLDARAAQEYLPSTIEFLRIHLSDDPYLIR